MNFMEWIKNNKTVSYVIGAVLVLLMLKKAAPKRRRVRRRPVRVVNRPKRRVNVRTKRKNVAGKKPWQIKGSLAAKRRMAQIRRMK